MKPTSKFLLALTAVLLSATTAFAVDIKIKSMDVEIEMPTAGAKVRGFNDKLISAKCQFGVLVADGEIQSICVTWEGEFDYDKKKEAYFKAGYSYRATIRLVFTHKAKKYYANFVQSGGSYVVKDFNLTVNGIPAEYRGTCSAMAPVGYFQYTVGGEASNAAKAEADTTFRKRIMKMRTTNKPFERSRADRLLLENCAQDLVVIKAGDYIRSMDAWKKILYIDKVLVDGVVTERELESLTFDVDRNLVNIREVWLSNTTDVVEYLDWTYRNLKDLLTPTAAFYQNYRFTDDGVASRKVTIYVPESKLAAVKDHLSHKLVQPVYTIKAYKGDVYEAQKNHNAYDFCKNHVYTAAIMASDRIYKYGTCSHDDMFYYSCTICGKCEYNPKHLFNGISDKTGKPKPIDPNKVYGHDYANQIADDDHYIGVNAAGHHVFWESCIWCDHSRTHNLTHPRSVDLNKNETIAASREWGKNQSKREEELALVKDKPRTDMYVLPFKTDAKVNPAAQSGVNWALNVNLVDDAVLGKDYTITATRGQLVSIAVKLAEELIGNPVPEASKSPYSDASDSYALKAATMNLTADFAANKLAPSTKVTRQEMATVIYRALRYVEQNSQYTYTDYDSKIDKYTDKAQLKQWAVEPMAFMNALELIKPATNTTLAPNAPCAIETVLGLAFDSTYAHVLGWYQTRPEEPMKGTIYMATLTDMKITARNFRRSERVWVVGRPIGNTDHLLPVIDPYSGDRVYVRREYLYPVRWRGDDPEEIVKAEVDAHTVKNTKPVQKNRNGTVKRTVTKKKVVKRTTH